MLFRGVIAFGFAVAMYFLLLGGVVLPAEPARTPPAATQESAPKPPEPQQEERWRVERVQGATWWCKQHREHGVWVDGYCETSNQSVVPQR